MSKFFVDVAEVASVTPVEGCSSLLSFMFKMPGMGKAMEEISLVLALRQSGPSEPTGKDVALVRRNVKLEIDKSEEFGKLIVITATFDTRSRAQRMNQMIITRLIELKGRGELFAVEGPSGSKRPDFVWPGVLGMVGVLAGVGTGLPARWPILRKMSPIGV